MQKKKFTSLTREQLLALPIKREKVDIANMAGAGTTPFIAKEYLDHTTGKVYQVNEQYKLVREAPTDNSPFGEWQTLED